MNAPDRSRDVQVLCEMHPEAFGPPAETNDARRLEFLQTTLVPFLNGSDAGLWGVLCKTNQGGKIPCDVIIWRDTLEHFDVMTGTGACWIPHGPVTNPAWVWQAVNTPVPPLPRPNPPAEPPPPAVDLGPIFARLDALETRVAMLSDRVVSIDHAVDDAAHRPYPRYVAKFWGVTIVSVPEGS